MPIPVNLAFRWGSVVTEPQPGIGPGVGAQLASQQRLILRSGRLCVSSTAVLCNSGTEKSLTIAALSDMCDNTGADEPDEASPSAVAPGIRMQALQHPSRLEWWPKSFSAVMEPSGTQAEPNHDLEGLFRDPHECMRAEISSLWKCSVGVGW